jgi:hypothetical protein
MLLLIEIAGLIVLSQGFIISAFFEHFFPITLRKRSSQFVDKIYTVKKRLAVFPSPAGMTLTKLSLGGDNLRLGTGKPLTFFYSVTDCG